MVWQVLGRGHVGARRVEQVPGLVREVEPWPSAERRLDPARGRPVVVAGERLLAEVAAALQRARRAQAAREASARATLPVVCTAPCTRTASFGARARAYSGRRPRRAATPGPGVCAYRDHADDAAERIRSVEHRRRTAHHLDALDRLGIDQVQQRVAAGPRQRIVQAQLVDHEQHAVAGQPADDRRRADALDVRCTTTPSACSSASPVLEAPSRSMSSRSMRSSARTEANASRGAQRRGTELGLGLLGAGGRHGQEKTGPERAESGVGQRHTDVRQPWPRH